MVTFRTRARTVDMLGRQQIAGIPTAISELFKNAHDAYATRVEIDYYRLDNLLILADDGIGMSKSEFVARWLTIGTENKLNAEQNVPANIQMRPRPMLGEKGIGRLAIATIGPQLLVLTRKIPLNGEVSELTAVFLNWRVFEWPGIDLDEIQIPLRTFPAGVLPSARDVAGMVKEFRENAKKISLRIEPSLFHEIDAELRQFDLDPQDIASYLPGPSLTGSGHGTHFIIKPASELLASDIDGDSLLKKETPLKKALLGFSNTMMSDTPSVLKTSFRDHKVDERTDELIGEHEFFTPEEFQNADHQISGRFDEYGQFLGNVSIYGEKISDHVIPWSGGSGARTNCGPFKINFAAFEGESRHSTIPNQEHARLAMKTEKIGGLYIYRNGIRILPYGDTDYDWLDIEFRRTKSAYYYYFSHRKMFGAVEIDAKTNQGLKEKAGREGFQENKAYRQFRSILQHFFLQIAADFFRTEGIYADGFEMRKAELSQEDEARKRRAQLVSEKKKKFRADMDVFFSKLANNAPEISATTLTERLEKQLRSVCEINDLKLASSKVLELERKAIAAVRELESQYRIVRPRIGLSKSALRDWNAYNAELASLQERVFIPTRELIKEMIDGEVQKAKLSLDRHVRTEATLQELGSKVRAKTLKSSQEVKNVVEEVATEIKNAAKYSLKSVDTEIRNVMGKLQGTDFDEMSSGQFADARNELENRVQTVMEEQSNFLESVLEQLRSIDISGTNTPVDQLKAIEQRNVLLEEEVAADAQLAQLGMAVEIINHEFSATIRSIRNSLQQLKVWANANKDLQDLYTSIRTNFDHLDGYLTLFTPLQRRLYRKAIEIHGSEIRNFLKELFRVRFKRHNVTFSATKAFVDFKFFGYPSDFYPVFVNLIDNAIFWLSQQNPLHKRIIKLDEQAGSLFISDTGPGVNVRDRDVIFEFGFSRKPGGRGMGLYIGRDSLRRVGFDLKLIDDPGGATFAIMPLDNH